MIGQLKICGLIFPWMIFLSIGTVAAQRDSQDRYGAIGIRPGSFSNLKKENQYTSAVCGVFMDYNFGKFRHSLEIDFLTKSFMKFFKNVYSPCFTYHVGYKKQFSNLELHSGAFINCRIEVGNKKEYIKFNDTAYWKHGHQTIFSLGPSLEISRKIFFSQESKFLILGFRVAYSFDVLGFGNTINVPYPPFHYTPTGRPWTLAAADRFQRDALTCTLKIGWGKFVQTKKIIDDDDVY